MKRRFTLVAACAAATSLLAASSASAKIAYQKGKSIYVADNAGKHAKKLGTGTYPTISPDGKRVLFVNKNRVYLEQVSSKRKVKLALRQSGIGRRVSWSPDGTKVATVNADTEPLLVPLDGGPVTKLSTDQTSGISFSPDGSEIAFGQEVSQTSAPIAIYTLATGTTRVIPGLFGAPLWTAGGIVALNGDAVNKVYSLVVLASDGTVTRTLFAKSATDGLIPQAMSSAGNRVVALVLHVDELDLVNVAVFDVTTGALVSQKSTRAIATAAALSLDGGRVYLMGSKGRLRVVNLTTGEKRSLIKRGVKFISST